jgi:broad specificity phosphatase PhoE
VLILVRHGQTPANAKGLLLGRADPPLTELGEQQARAVAAFLPRPDRLISSPLRRAATTAAAFGADVEIDERWVELDYGTFDGVAPSDVPVETWRTWRNDATFCPGGGECLVDLRRRVEDACNDLVEAARDQVVVVVSHVSPIKAAIAWALQVPDHIAWRMHVEDASISRIDISANGPSLRWFNRHAAPTG